MGYKSRPGWEVSIQFCKGCGIRLPDDHVGDRVCQECQKGVKGVLYERRKELHRRGLE